MKDWPIDRYVTLFPAPVFIPEAPVTQDPWFDTTPSFAQETSETTTSHYYIPTMDDLIVPPNRPPKRTTPHHNFFRTTTKSPRTTRYIGDWIVGPATQQTAWIPTGEGNLSVSGSRRSRRRKLKQGRPFKGITVETPSSLQSERNSSLSSYPKVQKRRTRQRRRRTTSVSSTS